MFVQSQKNTVVWPVEYHEPKDGGGFTTHNFRVEYKRLRQSRIDDLFAHAEAARNGELSKQEAAGFDAEVVDEVLIGWFDAKNPDGTEFEPNAVNRAILLDMPGMRATLVKSFFETINGMAERKNSKTPRTTG